MTLIADGLLLAAALTAAVYCHVLAGRLRRLRSLDGGVGQAVAAMSAQVEEMRAALRAAKSAAGDSTRTLAERTARAEMAAGRLELLLAALHDREGSAPVDIGARRAASGGRRSDATAGGGGATGDGDGAPATRLSLRPASAPAEAVARRDAPGLKVREDPPAEPEPAGEAAAEASAGETAQTESAPDAPTQAPPAGGGAPAPASRGRRLFRIERPETPDTPAAGPDRSGADSPQDEAATLRAALEALARESAE